VRLCGAATLLLLRSVHWEHAPRGRFHLATANSGQARGERRPGRPVADALAECRKLVGQQFTAVAVEALEALHEQGDLAMAALRMHRPTPEPVRAA